jgi:type IV conjugative transfer system coupling protein TraD
MKSLHNSAVGDFTRGGQVTIHFLRMITQVVQKFGLAAILLYSIITFSLFYFHTEAYNRYLGARWVGAWLGVQIGNGPQATDIKKANGTVVDTTIQGLVDHRGLQDNASNLLGVWLHCMGQSAQCAGLVLFILFLWLYRFGRSQRQEQRLRGAQLVSAQELTKIIKDRKVGGDLKFGGIPLVKDSETAHMLLTGSSGTGKTTGMYELLKQIRSRGDRVVCFSPSGDFISWFYRPGKDRILNIFDGRSPAWDLWAECDQPYHYPMIAASMIPVPLQGEKIWAEAAQSLVAVLLREMHKRSTPTIAELIRIVSVLPMASIYEYVKGTEVAANLDPSNERMGASIRSTATIALRSLTYLRDAKETFTFKHWVTGEDDGSWLFLNARADQIDASRPVLSTWIEVFVSRMLSLPESRDRRIWLVIDELPTLNRLNSLGLFVEQARKFGGCAMLGFQQFSQLKLIYGPELGASIIGQCNTWICYRQNDPETAKFVADKFGKVEIEENQQGLSYGANDMRDGVSLNQQRKDREVVLPSEIMNFPNFKGLIKLVGDLPAARFEITRGTIKTVAEPYMAPEFDPVEELLKIPVDQLLDLSGDDPLADAESGVRLDQAAPVAEPALQPAEQQEAVRQPEQEDLFQKPRESEQRRAASL